MNDYRYALRQLFRSPLLTASVVLMLALGIGFNTAIFSAAKHSLRPDLPFRDGDQLVRVYQVPDAGTPNISPRAPAFMLVRDEAEAFAGIAASRFTDLSVITPEGPERMVGSVVTPGWLEVLGVSPALGRGFSPDEERGGRESGVVLLSYAMWQSNFGGREEALGSTLRLNGRPHEIIGVMPPRFSYPYGSQAWLPFRPEHDAGEAFWALNIQARLAPTGSLQATRDELRIITERAAGETPGLGPGMTLTAVPTRDVMVGGQGRTMVALMIAAGFVLLVVCVNLAHLLLSRALMREWEFALRSSLGATRGRLVRQTLAESLVLGGLGGLAAVLLARWGIRFLEPLLPSRLSDLGAALTLDTATFGYATAASVVTALIVGLAPALRLSSTNPMAALRSGAVAMTARRGRTAGARLMVVELAITLVLLTGVGLMIRDFQALSSVELGYNPDGLLVFSVALDREPYLAPEARLQLTEHLAAELDATTGITAAGATSMFPRHRGNTLANIRVEGQDDLHDERQMINHRLVTPGFLEGLGAGLVRGRWLNDGDREGTSPVALVSASLANRYWPNEDPIGRRLRNLRLGDEAPWVTVVGVVDDVREDDEVGDSWYLPYRQNADGRGGSTLTFAIRGPAGDQVPSLSAVKAAVGRVDSELPIFEAMTAEALNGDAVARERQGALLGSTFAIFSLLLAVLGVYGSTSYTVGLRMREFGVRLALGSEPRKIVRSVLGEVARRLLVGGLLGLLGAIALSRFLGSMLAGIGPFDPLTFSVAIALLVLAALGAGAVPAWRASRSDPADLLRSE